METSMIYSRKKMRDGRRFKERWGYGLPAVVRKVREVI
jgi:hypothetical protein